MLKNLAKLSGLKSCIPPVRKSANSQRRKCDASLSPEAGFSVTGSGFLQMRECATAGALAVCMLTSAYHSESYLRPCIQKSFRASATLHLQMWKTQLLLLQFTHEKHVTVYLFTFICCYSIFKMNFVSVLRIRGLKPFWSLDPGWVKKVQYPDSGWTSRILFPRASKQFSNTGNLQCVSGESCLIWDPARKNSDLG